MRSLTAEKSEAIRLRLKGLSYDEILKSVSVAKSTLSLWLKELPLTDSEKAVLKDRRDANISRGRARAGAVLQQRRIDREAALLEEAKREFEVFKSEPLFFVGLSLYWAEGAKRHNSFMFVNSDAAMIALMIEWITKFFGVSKSEIHARLYLHKPYAQENCELMWATSLGIPIANFRRTIYKPTGLLVKKRPNYMGCLRIELGPVAFLKKYLFWQKMLLVHFKNQR